jgi:dihydrofolate reductase
MGRLSLIVAMTHEGVIGRGGKLPWRLSDDLKRFKALTMGHHLIMGRKTFDSLGRALPGRTTVIITRQSGYEVPAGASAVHTVDEALDRARADSEPFVVGGAEIYRAALARVNRLYVTWVEAQMEGDVRFPAIEWNEWKEVTRESRTADQKNEYPTNFCIYDRVTTKRR